jgi:hypothetical protein
MDYASWQVDRLDRLNGIIRRAFQFVKDEESSCMAETRHAGRESGDNPAVTRLRPGISADIACFIVF